jgi:hypothetical protein
LLVFKLQNHHDARIGGIAQAGPLAADDQPLGQWHTRRATGNYYSGYYY